MKKSILSILNILIILNSSIFAKENNHQYFFDSVVISKYYTILYNEIEKVKKDQEKYDYKEKYFSDMLGAQNNIYSINTALFSGIVSFFFILIGFIAYWGITSKFKDESKKLSENNKKTMKEIEDIKLKIDEDSANIYIAHMYQSSSKPQKLLYMVLAIKYFLRAKKFETTNHNVTYLKNELWDKINDEKFSEEKDFNKSLDTIQEAILLNKKYKENKYFENIKTTLTTILTTFNKIK
jgi:hypothetical protein